MRAGGRRGEQPVIRLPQYPPCPAVPHASAGMFCSFAFLRGRLSSFAALFRLVCGIAAVIMPLVRSVVAV